jgi:hypothetical protein
LKAETGRVGEEKRRRKKIKKEKVSEERRSRCAKRRNAAKTWSFSNDLWLRRVEKRFAKAAGVEPAGQMRGIKNCTPLWCKAHFQVKSAKKLTGPEHFWKVYEGLRCRKSARWRPANFQVKILSGRRSARDMFIELLGGQGADFLRRDFEV